MSTDLLQLSVLSMALFELSLNALVGKDGFWRAVALGREGKVLLIAVGGTPSIFGLWCSVSKSGDFVSTRACGLRGRSPSIRNEEIQREVSVITVIVR